MSRENGNNWNGGKKPAKKNEYSILDGLSKFMTNEKIPTPEDSQGNLPRFQDTGVQTSSDLNLSRRSTLLAINDAIKKLTELKRKVEDIKRAEVNRGKKDSKSSTESRRRDSLEGANGSQASQPSITVHLGDYIGPSYVRGSETYSDSYLTGAQWRNTGYTQYDTDSLLYPDNYAPPPTPYDDDDDQDNTYYQDEDQEDNDAQDYSNHSNQFITFNPSYTSSPINARSGSNFVNVIDFEGEESRPQSYRNSIDPEGEEDEYGDVENEAAGGSGRERTVEEIVAEIMNQFFCCNRQLGTNGNQERRNQRENTTSGTQTLKHGFSYAYFCPTGGVSGGPNQDKCFNTKPQYHYCQNYPNLCPANGSQFMCNYSCNMACARVACPINVNAASLQEALRHCKALGIHGMNLNQRVETPRKKAKEQLSSTQRRPSTSPPTSTSTEQKEASRDNEKRSSPPQFSFSPERPPTNPLTASQSQQRRNLNVSRDSCFDYDHNNHAAAGSHNHSPSRHHHGHHHYHHRHRHNHQLQHQHHDGTLTYVVPKSRMYWHCFEVD